jgi:hypothetical protein
MLAPAAKGSAMRTVALLSLAALLAATPSARAADPWLPHAPGTARCELTPGGAALGNAALRYAVGASAGALGRVALENRVDGTRAALGGELFVLALRAGGQLAASGFRIDGALECAPLVAAPAAARLAERRAGVELHARLVAADGALVVHWAAQLRDGANYVREVFRIATAHDLDVAGVTLVDVALPGAGVAGVVDGSPLVAGSLFLGIEHPMAQASAVGGRACARLQRALPLRAGVPVEYSAVLGVAPAGQLRRGFAAYLEAERAHPFRTFLHYNSWYDIGYFTPYSEADALGAIRAYGEQLVRARGVRIDSFLFDDGWDDTAHLWQFHGGFPRGFAGLAEAAAVYGAAPGIWLSPWGGYGPPRRARLATAAAAGYEVDAQGLALSGPRYYPLFHDAALGLLANSGINQFKLDGVGSPDKVTPGSAFDSDFAAAMALIGDLRERSPSLFINLTTGTWPSPFWLRTADAIWRGGEDHSFLGSGSDRQRWITYRDADTYGGIVRQGPLYPLNSLMLHGIIYARHARGLDSDPGGDLAAEAWSYFASGTGLQELYVSPQLLTARDWDTLAAAARWARERGEVLRDSHWVGGDPAREAVYGWASWAPGHAVIALRNPSAKAQSFVLRLGEVLELPAGEPRRFRARAAFGAAPPAWLSADQPRTLRLPAHAVVVWDLSAAR